MPLAIIELLFESLFILSLIVSMSVERYFHCFDSLISREEDVRGSRRTRSTSLKRAAFNAIFQRNECNITVKCWVFMTDAKCRVYSETIRRGAWMFLLSTADLSRSLAWNEVPRETAPRILLNSLRAHAIYYSAHNEVGRTKSRDNRRSLVDPCGNFGIYLPRISQIDISPTINCGGGINQKFPRRPFRY